MSADHLLTRAFLTKHPLDAARLLERTDPVLAAGVLSGCSPEIAAGTLKYMDPAGSAAVFSHLKEERISTILPGLPAVQAALMLRLVDRSERERILAAAPEREARILRLTLKHPQNTAGSLMDPAVLAVPADMTVDQAHERVRRWPTQARYYIYVVDGSRKPVGVLNLRELLLAPAGSSLASLMRSPAISVQARSGAKTVLEHPGWRELHALPVVDDDGVLVGILRRETFEKLRSDSNPAEVGSTGVALAMTELFWTLTAAVIDEVAVGARRRVSGGAEGSHDDD